MIRVLHFFKTYLPDSVGGIEQVIFQLSEGCFAYGIESEVVSLSSRISGCRVPLNNHHVTYEKLDFELASTGISFSAFSNFKKLSDDFDIIHYHYPWPFMDLVHIGRNIRKPSVVTYHSDVVRQKLMMPLYSPLMHKFLGSVDAIVASSDNYLSTSPVLSSYSHKVSVIPFGLDIQSYPDSDTVDLPDFGVKFFLFVGALRYYKGLDYLLDAAKELSYPIVIAGDGPEYEHLRSKIIKLDLSNRVFLIGMVSDEQKVQLLKSCYAFLFPSHLRSEAFGISLLEAAMFGKPMISTEIGTGTSFINLDGKTGLIVPPASSNHIRDAMRFLWNNEDIATEYGRHAKSRYQNTFSSEKMCSEYAAVYRKVLDER